MIWLWLGFFALVGMLLLIQRSISVPPIRTAAYWAAGWFLVGLSFVGLVYPMYEHAWLGATLVEPSDRPGADALVMFISAYLLEYALSFDTIRVISLQCQLHRIPRRHLPRVLFWGLVGSIFFRVIILTGAASLVRTFAWTFYVFGALAICYGVWLLKRDDDEEVPPGSALSAVGQRKHMRLARMLWRIGRLTDREHGETLWVVQGGRRVLTMAAACVLAVASIDILFALDTVGPALSISKTTFIVVTSNILAAIALRSWVFMLSTLENVQAPRKATALLFGVLGLKMIAYKHLHVPPAASLAVIAGLIGIGVAEALPAARRSKR